MTFWFGIGAVALLTCALAAPVLAAPWKIQKNTAGISVYSRDVADTGIDEIQGATFVNTSLASLLGVFLDPKSALEMLPNCKQFKVVEVTSPAERITYSVVGAPWPFDDRDTYMHSKVSYDEAKKRIEIRMSGRENYAGTHAGKVRVHDMRGLWRFTEVKPGRVKVVYQIFSDPQVPSEGAVNGQVVDMVHKTLGNLRSMVKRPVYQSFTIDPEMRAAISR